MTSTMKDLLIIQSFDLSKMIEDYRLFFLALLPSVFILAVLIEYLDRLEPFTLVKRAFISILVLTSVSAFYYNSIDTSMEVADEILKNQKQGNILLMDMFDGVNHWDKVKYDDKGKDFYKDKNILWGTLGFLKYHLFDSFVNDGFTVSIFFISKLCFLILKVVYSLVYYLGYGLIGIPCLIYLFPSMGNVLRGAFLSFIWCLIVPHILVFIISMIGTEINKGYISGQIIGGSMIGTALLFILTLFIAFTPLIGAMILTGAGISQAGGIIASVGANYVMNLPKNAVNAGATVLTGGALGPKMQIASKAVGSGYKLAGNVGNNLKSSFSSRESSKSSKKATRENSVKSSSINDVVHISKFMKDLQQTLNSSNNYNPSGKNTDVSKVKFKLGESSPSNSNQKNNNGQNISQRSNDAKLSKHSRINSQSEKASYPNRRSERHSSPDSSERRSSNKYKKPK